MRRKLSFLFWRFSLLFLVTKVAANVSKTTENEDLEDEDLGAGRDLFSVSNILLTGGTPSEDAIRKKAPPPAEELASRVGYRLEPYKVTTNDGYNLVVHRLLSQIDGRTLESGQRLGKPVVLLQHGISQSSGDWLINDSGKSLAMMLVDNGYDVWLGNARGNRYSNSHVSLQVETMEYFNFTFHEVGVYDIPVTIDLILYETQQPQINFIGSSIGATVFFVALSHQPAYAARVKFMAALSPLAFLSHTKSPLKVLVPHLEEIKESSVRLEVLRIKPDTLPDLINNQLGRLCFWRQLSRALCNSIYQMLDAFGLRWIEEEHVDQLWKYIPTTTSAKTCTHLLQLMTTEGGAGVFEEYDYGPLGNAAKYKSTRPPPYHLENVRVPVALFTGKGELFTTAEDVEVLKRALPYVVHHTEADTTFKVHTDFTHEARAIDRVFKPIVFILNFYNKQQPPAQTLK